MKIPTGIKIDHDVTLFSAFKTPAVARYFFDMHDHDDHEKLHEIALWARENNLPIVLIGAGTNCLFAFDIFDGIIIRNHNTGWEDPFERNGKLLLSVYSGTSSHALAEKLYTHFHISTLVPWIGLPGTFGGATIGNAGCFGVEMSDIFVSADVLDLETGEVHVWEKHDMQYAYRHSALKWNSRYFVLSTLIDLTPLWWEYESYTPENLKSIRRVKQPAGISCGSFFMNPIPTESQKEILSDFLTPLGTLSSGRLIDRAWLKWTRIGWIKVSEQHGNFFINDQKATYQDILALSDFVKNKISDMYGVYLHEEVRIIDNFQSKINN